MARRAWKESICWLDGLSTFQAVGGYFLVSLLTGVLLATVGKTTASYGPFFAALGLFIFHCTRRQDGWDVFGCGTGPGALVAMLAGALRLHGLVDAILGIAALLLSPLMAWRHDHPALDPSGSDVAD